MYTVEGMACEGCVEKVRSVFKARQEVIEARVLLSRAKAIVSLREPLSIETLNSALRKEGHYSATEITTPHPIPTETRKQNASWLKFFHRKKPCCR